MPPVEMPYHLAHDFADAVNSAIHNAGERVSEQEIAVSVEGRPVRAITVAAPNHRPDPDRLQALVTANIHGSEVIASEVALGLLELLCEDTPGDGARELLDVADVTVVPIANPDGRARAFASLDTALPVSIPRRTNGRGVDLNRNFPYPSCQRDVWHPLSGTDLTFLPWYRGPEPLSERESHALKNLAEELRPFASVALHAVGRLFLYPHCYTREAPADQEKFLAMGAAFRARQPHWKYKVKQSAKWYAILGDLDDWLYDELGTLACTIEISRVGQALRRHPARAGHLFWWVNPAEPEPSVENDAPACLATLFEAYRQHSSP